MNLDRRLQLYQRITTRNNSGQFVKSWELVDTVWASLNPQADDEREINYQLVGKRLDRWVIRWRADVDYKWRLKYQDVWYEVRGFMPNSRRTFLTILGEARDNDPA